MKRSIGELYRGADIAAGAAVVVSATAPCGDVVKMCTVHLSLEQARNWELGLKAML